MQLPEHVFRNKTGACVRAARAGAAAAAAAALPAPRRTV
jgi:hypothetical protein